GSDNRLVGNFYMAHDSRFTRNDAVVSDLGRAGNPGLGGDNGIFSNDHIVGYLHQIIDFSAFFNQSRTHSSPVDRCISSDTYIIYQANVPQLRYIFVGSVRLWGKSESI